MAEEPRTIFVVPHPENGDRVALWEVHPAHPGGEVFIAGQDTPPCEVAVTPGVLEALAPQGGAGGDRQPPRLVEIEGTALSQRKALAERVQEQRRLQRREALARGASVVANPSVVPPELTDDQQKQLTELQARLVKLEGDLAKEREKAAAELEKTAEQEATSERRERQAERRAQLAHAPEPAQLDTYDYNEPRQLETDEVRVQPESVEVGRRRENARRRSTTRADEVEGK